MANRKLRGSQLTSDWLRGVGAVVGAIGVIGQHGGGGGVSTDDKIQAIWRLCDQRNDEAAVEVSGPHVVDLKDGHTEVDSKDLRYHWMNSPAAVTDLIPIMLWFTYL